MLKEIRIFFPVAICGKLIIIRSNMLGDEVIPWQHITDRFAIVICLAMWECVRKFELSAMIAIPFSSMKRIQQFIGAVLKFTRKYGHVRLGWGFSFLFSFLRVLCLAYSKKASSFRKPLAVLYLFSVNLSITFTKRVLSLDFDYEIEPSTENFLRTIFPLNTTHQLSINSS